MNRAPIVAADDADYATETYDTAIFGSMAADGPDHSLRIEELEDCIASFISNTEFNNTIKIREQEDEPGAQQYRTTKGPKPPRTNKRNSINNYHSYNGKEAQVTEGRMSLVAPPEREKPSSSSK